LRGRVLVARYVQHAVHRARRDAAQRIPTCRGGGNRWDAELRRQAGDQTGQESRSSRHAATASVTAMDITINASFLPQNDPDAATPFYRDVLGFEVRNDVGFQ